jgi:hypothetical protein
MISEFKERDWHFWVRRLKAFRQKYGHSSVPAKWHSDPSLARWVWHIRSHLAELSFDRLEQLHDLGFDFGRYDRFWVASFVDLIAYKRQFGQCRVPSGSREHGSLANWLRNQRRLRGSMAAQRRKLLERLEVDWEPRESRWNGRYAELCAFKDRHGHCRVPQQWRSNPQLGHWVAVLRKQRNRLGAKRKWLLDKIGFDWDPFETVWENRFRELIDFKRRFGHCNVPHRWKESPALASWVRTLRNNQTSVTPVWKKRLDQIEFGWAGRCQWIWNRYYTELAAFQKSHGHCNVPVRYTQSPKLGRWVTLQRSSQDSISSNCKRRLNDLGFDWTRRKSSPEREWDEWFAILAAFKTRFGHCNVPYRWVENPRLGHWVCNQRYILERSPSQERKRKLDSLDFVWDPKEAEWEDQFANLREFHKRFGHCNVSVRRPEHAALGRWVRYQRFYATALNSERKDRLNRLGFVLRPG